VTTTAADFWAELGNPNQHVRGFLEERGLLSEYLNGLSAQERELTVEDACGIRDSLERHGLVWRSGGDELEASDDSDGRWVLLHDLGKRWADDVGASAPPAPLRFRCGYEWDALGQVPRVSLDFDGRVSLRAVLSGVRSMWPLMAANGWVRRTRPLGDRKLALVRFVCLETEIGTGWEDRRKAWNEAHPEAEYPDRWSLRSDFSKAEESLTGQRGGLARFYDAEQRQRAMPQPLDTRTAEEIIASTLKSDAARRVAANAGDAEGGHNGKP